MSSISRLYEYSAKDIYNQVIKYMPEGTGSVAIDDFTAKVENGAVKSITKIDTGVTYAATGISELASEGAYAIDWSVAKVVTGYSATMDFVEKSSVTLLNYLSPSSTTLNTFKEVGKEMDDFIKDSLFLQFFGITKEDILCSAFCFILSLLDCKTRNDLYNSVIGVQRQMTAATTALNAIRDISTQFNVAISGIKTVTEAAYGIASGNLDEVYTQQSTGMNLGMGVAAIKATIQNVEGIVDTINTCIDFINKGRILYDMVEYSNIWNLARNILFQFQAQAMEIADEILNDIFQPLEDLLQDATPTNCMQNMGSIVFNKMLEMINAFKAWLVTLIGELFTEFTSFKQMMKTFNYKSKNLMYLAMLMEALKTIAYRFGDIAIICGLEPCSESDGDGSSNNGGNSGSSNNKPRIPDRMMPSPVGVTTIKEIDQVEIPNDNIDELAEIFKETVGNIDDAFVTPEKIVTMRNILQGAPKMLLDLADGVNLGQNYTIAKANDHVKVIYTLQRQCGA